MDAVELPEFAVMQIGGAAPAGNAAESVLWFDTVNDDLYVNADGANTWQLIAGGGGAVAPHNILSASHSDTATDVPTRGSLIVSSAVPDWDELDIGGARTLLQVNAGGTDPAWTAFDWDNMAAAAGADMVHSHANAGEGGNIAVAAISDLAYAAPSLTLGVANAAGAANTVIRTDATILAFDATVPNIIQPDDSAAAGAATVAARRDHEHGIVAAAPAANLTVSTSNAEGAGTSFARNDHGHAITSSSNPGAAASLLATDVNGDISVQDLTIAEFIIHAGDADTYIQAQIDRWDHYAGNLRLLELRESAGDGFVTVNEDGVDVDFRVEAVGVSDALQVLGSTGEITLGALAAGIVQSDANGVLSSDFVIGSETTFQDDIILSDILFINETVNTRMTYGVTINQGTSDDEVISMKSSDVNHPMTDWGEADTYGWMRKGEADSGGLLIVGLKDADGINSAGVQILGLLGEAADTGKTTADYGVIVLNAAVTDGGTGIEVVGADGNLVSIGNLGVTRFIFDAEGSAHADVEWTTFDEHDDIALLNALEQEFTRRSDPVKDEFGQFMEERRRQLQAAQIVNFYDDGPRGMVNMTRLAMLLTGAVRQIAQQTQRHEQLLEGICNA